MLNLVLRMHLRIAAVVCSLSILTLVATAQPAAEPQVEGRPPMGGYQARARKHIGRSGDHIAVSPSSGENAAEPGISGSAAATVPTRSSFIANWQRVNEATGYRLNVSTSNSFNHYVNGYHDFDVGKATSWVVSGLTPGVKYYYRVRAYNAIGTSSDSAVMSAATAGGAGLIINATFDSSILNNPNSAAIEATINQAISIYESLFSDPITVSILFRYATTNPDGTPIDSGAIAESNFGVYAIPWNTYIAALRADAKTNNDIAANASLPSYALSTNIVPSSAGGRAVGLDTPPEMFGDSSVGSGGPYDGIVTLNSTQPFQFNRPTSANNYDALRSTEHEIDEVLGLGSYINSGSNDLEPQDLFSWSSPGTRNITSIGSRYLSIDSGNTDIVDFNQDANGDFGDWLSESCPQAHPYVQNAFSCMGQFSDVTATSPEGINLDIIGYDLVIPGNGDTAVGTGALFSLTSGSYNTAMGLQALYSNTSGGYNTANGVNALYRNTIGNYNTASGLNALYSNTSGGYNTANGLVALFSNTTGSLNTATGDYALYSNTVGGYDTAAGVGALSSNTTGNYNTATGDYALYNNTSAHRNTATGAYALFNNSTGLTNMATGVGALYSNSTGSNNMASGNYALYSNTIGSNNIALGGNAGYNLTTGNNNIDIGNRGSAGEANTIRIGVAGTQIATFIAGIHGEMTSDSGSTVPVVVDMNGNLGTAASSERFKKDIKSMGQSSEAILRLKPVTFHYKNDSKATPQFGLVAEEVAKVNPDLVVHDAKGAIYTVRYDAVNAMLLNEFLKEHCKVEEQERKIHEQEGQLREETAMITQLKAMVTEQQKTMEALRAGLKEQARQIQKVSAQLEMDKPATPVAENN